MRSRSWTCLVAFALLLSPFAAQAAPATIRVFEAEVHAQPDRSSPVIHTFPENARVSVSEDSVNGFRRVRLPDGKVGYVEEGALSLATGRAPARPAPAPPPPSAGTAPPSELPGPPPPPYAGPPPAPPYGGPPPPPPAVRPYRYPVRRYYDPTAFRHVGFFFRFDLGLGYLGTSTSPSATDLGFDKSHGVAGELGLAMGGALSENAILAGHFWAVSAFSPRLTSGGTVVSNGDFSTTLFGIGPSFDYYFMPQNVYVTITPSLTWIRLLSDGFNNFDSDVGFGTRFALGKEWWVAPHFGIGLAGWFAFSFNKEGTVPNPTWHTYAGGVSFSATIN